MSWWKAGIYETVGKCRECGSALLSKHAWNIGIRREGHAGHGGRGLCIRCYSRIRERSPRPRGSQRPRAPLRPIEDTLSEYAMIRDDVNSIAQAAERMGMTFVALDRALYRARKKGLDGALPPIAQIDRAIRRGQAHYLRRSA